MHSAGRAQAMGNGVTRVRRLAGSLVRPATAKPVGAQNEPMIPTPAGHSRRETTWDALAIGAATGAYAVSFGALAVTSGFDLWQTQAMSAFMFTGASQFALVATMGAGGTALAAVATALLLGLRNGLYALSLSSLLDTRGWRRPALAHLTIDESTAMAVAQADEPDPAGSRYAFIATGVSVFVLWNLGTLIGAYGAAVVGDPRVYGLDAAAAAAFLALLWPRLNRPEARVVAVLAAVVTLILIPVTSPGIPVLVSALVAVAAGLRRGIR